MQYQEVKICLLGDSGVGKSSIVQRFVHNTFTAGNESTIGASFMTKTFIYKNTNFKFNIWDTAGQERYRALAPMYYRGAVVCIIAYDVTSMASFKSVHSWVRELQTHLGGKTILVIAGNKSDLSDRREVPIKEAKTYAESIGAAFVETSAKNSQNIQELFCTIASKIPRENQKNPSQNVSLGSTDAQQKKKCC